MSRCVKFHHAMDADWNFCGMSDTSISYYKHYRETVKKLVSQGLDEDFIYENFKEGPDRVIGGVKDDETRTMLLDYVSACLHRNEEVTGGDLVRSLKAWRKSESGRCNLTNVKSVTPDHSTRSENLTNVKSVTPDTDVKTTIPLSLAEQTRQKEVAETPVPIPPAPCAARLKEKYNGDGQEHAAPAAQPPTIPDPQPAPCRAPDWNGKCPDMECHIDKTSQILGTRCNLVGVPINQLIEDECPVTRAAQLKGMPVEEFVKASLISRMDGTKTIRPDAPHRIVPTRVDEAQAEQWLTAIIRGLFTASEQDRWERLRKLVEKEGNYEATNCGTLQQLCEWMDERI